MPHYPVARALAQLPLFVSALSTAASARPLAAQADTSLLAPGAALEKV